MIMSFLSNHPYIQAKWIDPMQNLGILLLDFLELYGKFFNYDQVGIHSDGYFPRECTNAKDSVEVSDKMKKLKDGGNAYLVVVDPINPENNVSKGSFCMSTVRASFDHAFNLMTSFMGDPRGSARGQSLLSGLLQADLEYNKHREWIKANWK
jgi:DNA polymerase sigma